ncbi:hypothetical protein [Halomonas sp. I5-271120]|uniref:hypothetical protein n=1 Tax=Halomonas sp. I5-271120 TaxID=3061632 RepID=UPI0027155AE3|nr:hypothetical protein [Halomonas sp. I5-271120]
MKLHPLDVITVAHDGPAKLPSGDIIGRSQRILVEKTSPRLRLAYICNGAISRYACDAHSLLQRFQAIHAVPLGFPVELGGWHVMRRAHFPEDSHETTAYQLTLAYENEPAVHAQNHGRGDEDLILGIGVRGSKHRLISSFRYLLKRMEHEGLVDPVIAASISPDSGKILDLFLPFISSGLYLIHPLDQCARDLSPLLSEEAYGDVATNLTAGANHD